MEGTLCVVRRAPLALSFAMMVGTVVQAGAQADIGRQIAPTGKLRVGVLMLSYFAVEDGGTLKGWSPELGGELARRAGVPHELVPIHNPAHMIDAFKTGRIDATFIGITKDRSAAFDFGPVLIGLRTTFLVPASSTIRSIGDRSGRRAPWCRRAAQGEHLERSSPRPPCFACRSETTKPATDLIAAGQADAFSHGADARESAAGKPGVSRPARQLLRGADRDRLPQGLVRGGGRVLCEFRHPNEGVGLCAEGDRPHGQARRRGRGRRTIAR